MRRFILVLLLSGFVRTADAAEAGVVPGHYTIYGCPGGFTPCFVPEAPLQPLGYQQITSLASATSLTVPTGANKVVIRGETQSIRYRDDGTSPTATIGQLILTTDLPLVYSGTLSTLKFIETTASAKINVLFYK